MVYIIIGIIIWAIIALIYSKVKKENYAISFIKIPFLIIWIVLKFIINAILEENSYTTNKMKREAIKQGNQEALDKINAQEEFKKEAKQKWDDLNKKIIERRKK